MEGQPLSPSWWLPCNSELAAAGRLSSSWTSGSWLTRISRVRWAFRSEPGWCAAPAEPAAASAASAVPAAASAVSAAVGAEAAPELAPGSRLLTAALARARSLAEDCCRMHGSNKQQCRKVVLLAMAASRADSHTSTVWYNTICLFITPQCLSCLSLLAAGTDNQRPLGTFADRQSRVY